MLIRILEKRPGTAADICTNIARNIQQQTCMGACYSIAL